MRTARPQETAQASHTVPGTWDFNVSAGEAARWANHRAGSRGEGREEGFGGTSREWADLAPLRAVVAEAIWLGWGRGSTGAALGSSREK